MPTLDERLTVAIRAARHHHLSYFYYAVSRHKNHESFQVEGWPMERELGFTCACSGEAREWRVSISSLREALPEAREAFMRFRDHHMNRGNKVRKHKLRQSERKARDLLYRFLTREQKWQLRGTGVFTVQGGDGRTYEVGSGTYLVKEGKRRSSFCLVAAKSSLPRHDMMLAHKVLLEGDPEAFLRTAHSCDLENPNVEVETIERPPRRPNEVCEEAMRLLPLPDEILDEPQEWVRQQIRQWWSEGRTS